MTMTKTTPTKTDRMEKLIDEINVLRRKEAYLHQKASECGLAAAKLRAKEQNLMSQALELEQQRYVLALEYNRIKNPCPKILIEAEKALGRKLTVDEIFEIEKFYAQKTRSKSCQNMQ